MNRQTNFGRQIDRLALGNIIEPIEQASGLSDILRQAQMPLYQPTAVDLDVIAQDQAMAIDLEMDDDPTGLVSMAKLGDLDEDQRTRRDYMVAMQGHKRRLISALSQLYIEATHL